MPIRILLLIAALALPATASAQRVATATFKRQEPATDSTTTCIYEHARYLYRQTIRSSEKCPTTVEVVPVMKEPGTVKDRPVSAMAMLTSQFVSAGQRQCVYDYEGTRHTRTVGEKSTCPAQISVLRNR